VLDHPIDTELTRTSLQDPRHPIAVAIDNGLVIGLFSGVHYVHSVNPPEPWIKKDALAPTHRRPALGNAVLKAQLEAGRAHYRTKARVPSSRVTSPLWRSIHQNAVLTAHDDLSA
jgi:hypothetical protein